MKVLVRRKANGDKVPVMIGTEYIKLDAAMKLANAVPSGGIAKTMIQDGEVTVNGEVCTMRGKKLRPGDVFECMGTQFLITIHEAQ